MQDTIESEVKLLEDNVLQFKTAQPFFDGQLKVYMITGSTITRVTTTTAFIYEFKIRFTSNVANPPLCNLFLKCGVGSNNQSDSRYISMRKSSFNTLKENSTGHIVEGIFRVAYSPYGLEVSIGTTLYFTPIAYSNDNGTVIIV